MKKRLVLLLLLAAATAGALRFCDRQMRQQALWDDAAAQLTAAFESLHRKGLTVTARGDVLHVSYADLSYDLHLYPFATAEEADAAQATIPPDGSSYRGRRFSGVHPRWYRCGQILLWVDIATAPTAADPDQWDRAQTAADERFRDHLLAPALKGEKAFAMSPPQGRFVPDALADYAPLGLRHLQTHSTQIFYGVITAKSPDTYAIRANGQPEVYQDVTVAVERWLRGGSGETAAYREPGGVWDGFIYDLERFRTWQVEVGDTVLVFVDDAGRGCVCFCRDGQLWQCYDPGTLLEPAPIPLEEGLARVQAGLP